MKDTLCGGIEDFLEKVRQQLESGALTEEEAIALAQQFMDELEYNEPQTVTDCGGIRPEVTERTERF